MGWINWRRGSAALPQIKNGRADLPVSPDIGDAQQRIPAKNKSEDIQCLRPLSRFVHGCELLAT
jgi:hypothetical protein